LAYSAAEVGQRPRVTRQLGCTAAAPSPHLVDYFTRDQLREAASIFNQEKAMLYMAACPTSLTGFAV
jgi:hypothetical protein